MDRVESRAPVARRVLVLSTAQVNMAWGRPFSSGWHTHGALVMSIAPEDDCALLVSSLTGA